MSSGRDSRSAARFARVALLGLATVTFLGGECDPKDPAFFGRIGSPIGLTDVSAPLITDFLPVPDVTLNDDFVMATINDPVGANGATPSGVDPASISAMGDDGADLPITMAGTNMYNADIASWGDGIHMIDWSALDLAGNEGTGSQTIEIDRTDPVLTVDPIPPTSATSNDASFSWTVGIGIVEPHFLDATYTVRLAGPDTECGTTDDVTPTAQQVPTSTFPLQEGSNTVDVVTNNGVAPGGQPMTAIYCGVVIARDDAVTKTGGSASNTTTSTQYRTELTWQPPVAPMIVVSFGNPAIGYCHLGSGSSITYTGIQTSPAQPNAPYSISWNGPGTVGGTMRSGSLDANGRALDQQSINQFGGYGATAMVTAGGMTSSASGTVDVTAAQGACLQASSLRYKRGVVALLPADVRPLGLNPVAFRYVEPWGDPAEPRIGLVAEEVAEVFPEAVGRDPQGRPDLINYRLLSRRVVETAVERAGDALEAKIARLATMF